MIRPRARRHRPALAVALAGAVAAGLTACSTGSVAAADYPAYASVSDLAAAADAVIQGVVLDQRAEDIDIVIHSDSDDPELNPSAGLPDDGDRADSDVQPFIVYRIEVAEAFAGVAAPGDVVELMVRDQTSAEREPRLDVGGAYLLFLSDAYPGNIPRSMLNPDQAAYRAEPDGRYASLTPESTIALQVTHADLELIRSAG